MPRRGRFWLRCREQYPVNHHLQESPANNWSHLTPFWYTVDGTIKASNENAAGLYELVLADAIFQELRENLIETLVTDDALSGANHRRRATRP